MSRNIAKNRMENKKIGEKTNSFRVSMKTRIVIFSIIFVLLCISYLLVGFDRVQAGGRKILARVGIYTEEIKSVEINSNNYGEPGSWHVEKSAEWIGPNQAQVTFKVDSVIKTNNNYKDIILVLDVSGSMAGSKIEKAISDSKSLVKYLLSNRNNHVAVITFSNDSTILTPFSNDKNLVLSKLDIAATEDSTNYNAALLNVDEVMSDYVKKTNRDVVTLFLTDGYPNKDTPNQIGTYTILKDKYPYMDINGIQYEMGKSVIPDIKKITDAQWVANKDTLHNVLFEATIYPMVYEDFILTDYVDDRYFKVDSVNDIKTSIGNVTLDDSIIKWDLSQKYVMGEAQTMTIKISLKEPYTGEEGFYPTNTKAVVETEKNHVLNDTPVLKNLYSVVYDTNTPNGCSVENIPTEKYFVYQIVNQKSSELSCDDYLFKGWEIEEENTLDRINDDMFYMPGQDIHIRAIWSKQSVVKTMSGSVHEKDTLYKVLQRTAETGGPAKEYTGQHGDSMDSSLSTEKIYHYWGERNNIDDNLILEKNNVIFANHCWQMYRTTDTGGVKLLYNGEVENNQCLNTRGEHVGYNGSYYYGVDTIYWYGTDYIYDETTKTFKLAGDLEQIVWSDATNSDVTGKYTCMLTEKDGSCSRLEMVVYKDNRGGAVMTQINSNSHYSQIGNISFNTQSQGYMYGKEYEKYSVVNPTSTRVDQSSNVLNSCMFDPKYMFSDSVTYQNNKYYLSNPYNGSSVSDYSELVGKYSILYFGSTEYTSVFYVVAVNDGTIYYKWLTNGETIDPYSSIMFGNSITENGDGTYTLNDVQNVTLTEWYRNYNNYKNKYTCGDKRSSCDNPRYVRRTSISNYSYLPTNKILLAKERNGLNLNDTINVRMELLLNNWDDYKDYKYTCGTLSSVCTEETLRMIAGVGSSFYSYVPNYYYGSSVTWDGNQYTLVDPVEMENYNNFDALSNHHYMCIDAGKKTCDAVAYIYGYKDSTMYTVILRDGVISADQVRESLLFSNENDSDIKIGIDAWYKKNLLSYDSYIEDTIFCHNRSIESLNGWNSNGGDIRQPMIFSSNDFVCPIVTDRFSITNNQARLTYKVGLMTQSEANMINNLHSLKTGKSYYLLSPDNARFDNFDFIMKMIDQYGVLKAGYGDGVRPVISLVPGIEYIDGDGSREHPYYVDTE